MSTTFFLTHFPDGLPIFFWIEPIPRVSFFSQSFFLPGFQELSRLNLFQSHTQHHFPRDAFSYPTPGKPGLSTLITGHFSWDAFSTSLPVNLYTQNLCSLYSTCRFIVALLPTRVSENVYTAFSEPYTSISVLVTVFSHTTLKNFLDWTSQSRTPSLLFSWCLFPTDSR